MLTRFSKNINKWQETSPSETMKDKLGKTFGKKEFFETLIVTIITLFLVCIAFLIPALFLLELLFLVIFLVAVLIIFWQKKKK